MRRKTRHPHQVLELSELSPGTSYAMLTLSEGQQSPRQTDRVMLGAVRESEPLVAAFGIEALFDLPRHCGDGFVSVHMDGWVSSSSTPLSEPTLVYWDPDGRREDYDPAWCFLGERELGTITCLVVPSAEWAADRRVHVVDWVNPDDTVARSASAAAWTTEEARLKARRDRAMRRALGF